jgi:uncharacterized OB-fold protein
MTTVSAEAEKLQPKDAFLHFLANGEIRFQRCSECGTRRWPARSVCSKCLSFDFTWEPAAAEGTINAYAVIHFTYVPGREIPFTLVHVDLDDGVRYTGKLNGVNYSGDLTRATDERIKIGERVRLILDTSGEAPEPRFELVEGGAS